MTEIESLEKSIELWTVLARTGSTKLAAIKELGWEYHLYQHNCPLCAYGYQFPENLTCCATCPMKNKWGLNSKIDGCLRHGSLFIEWGTSGNSRTSKMHWAKLILHRLHDTLDNKLIQREKELK